MNSNQRGSGMNATPDRCDICRFAVFAHNDVGVDRKPVELYECHLKPPIQHHRFMNVLDDGNRDHRNWMLPIVQGDSFCGEFEIMKLTHA